MNVTVYLMVASENPGWEGLPASVDKFGLQGDSTGPSLYRVRTRLFQKVLSVSLIIGGAHNPQTVMFC